VYESLLWVSIGTRIQPATDGLRYGERSPDREVWVLEKYSGLLPGSGPAVHFPHSGASAAHWQLSRAEADGRISESEVAGGRLALGHFILAHPGVLTVEWPDDGRLIARSVDGTHVTLAFASR